MNDENSNDSMQPPQSEGDIYEGILQETFNGDEDMFAWWLEAGEPRTPEGHPDKMPAIMAEMDYLQRRNKSLIEILKTAYGKVIKEEKAPVTNLVTEKTTHLTLEDNPDGSVTLCAVDDNGKPVAAGNILDIGTNGKLYLYRSISPKLGLKLDSLGRIIVEREG